MTSCCAGSSSVRPALGSVAGTHVTSPNQLASLNSSERKDIKKNMRTSLSVCPTLALPQRQLTSSNKNYIHFTLLAIFYLQIVHE